MELASASEAASTRLDDLRESGVITEWVALEPTGELPERARVRPVAGDDLGPWMPKIGETIGVAQGVVAFSGPDMAAVAHLAADAAAWLGDRGKRVVLADGSVERPVLEKPHPGDGDEGLVDAVLYGVSPRAVVRRTLSTGVSVVTAGSLPLSVSGVFDDGKLTGVLKELARDALVLILVPPPRLPDVSGALDAFVCLATEVTDIESLASTAGGVRTAAILAVDERAGTAAADLEQGGETSVPPSDAGELPGDKVPEATVDDVIVTAPAESRTATTMTAGSTHPTARRARPRRRAGRLAGTLAVLAIAISATVFWWLTAGERGPTAPDDRTGSTPVSMGQDQRAEGVDTEPVQERALTAAGETAYERVDGSEEAVERTGGATRTAGSDVKDGAAEMSAEISGPGGPYRVMISSHYHETAARVEAGELVELGVATEVRMAEVENRGTWYRVLVSGGYPTLGSARSVLDTVKSFGYEGAWIECAAETQ